MKLFRVYYILPLQPISYFSHFPLTFNVYFINTCNIHLLSDNVRCNEGKAYVLNT